MNSDSEQWVATAHTAIARAEHWISENPQAWAVMTETALHEAACKRHFSMQWIVEQIRRKDYVTRAGEPCKVQNSFVPVFTRIMCKQHPEIRPYLEMRKSQFDGLI